MARRSAAGGGDHGSEVEGGADLVGDGGGLLARAEGAQAHAVQAPGGRHVRWLGEPGQVLGDLLAEARRVLGAREGAELEGPGATSGVATSAGAGRGAGASATRVPASPAKTRSTSTSPLPGAAMPSFTAAA